MKDILISLLRCYIKNLKLDIKQDTNMLTIYKNLLINKPNRFMFLNCTDLTPLDPPH